MSYYIAKIRSFFGPREELSFAQDDYGDRLECLAWKADQDISYVRDHAIENN